MTPSRLRAAAILLLAGIGVSACAYDDYGYGYGRTYSSVSIGVGGCDPYWGSCYGRGYYDPWWGWYGGYYYPGIGIYVYDSWGRRFPWNEYQRGYWENRRQRWGGRNWNDHRWERWDGFRSGRGYYPSGQNSGSTWGNGAGNRGGWTRHGEMTRSETRSGRR
jgi:hypothetical protein